MVIVHCQGGLGNQMFQYALYRVLRKLGRDVYLDIDDFGPENPRGFELPNAFGITFRKFRYQLAIGWITKVGGLIRQRKDRPHLRYLIGTALIALANRLRKIVREAALIIDDREFVNLDSLNYTGTIIFEGYWQSSDYFCSIKSEIRRQYQFRAPLDQAVVRKLEEVHECDSVSIHFRRGDYVDNQVFKTIYGGICTDQYYEKAINYIEGHVSTPKYFVFSDDIEYAKTIPLLQRLSRKEYVSFPKGNNWDDMMLMSNCKHNILANSTYSWWASWLNANPAKIVLVPSRWVNLNHGYSLSDLKNIYEDDWIRIDP
jgi:hypothetical protein